MITAILLAKNEEDILPFVIENTLKQVDKILAIDNDSTDKTYEILTSYNAITIFKRSGPYHHSRWHTELTSLAREQGAHWVVPVDADEIWTNIKYISTLNESIGLVRLDHIYDHSPTAHDGPFHIDKLPYFEKIYRPIVPRLAFKPYFPVAVAEGAHSVSPQQWEEHKTEEITVHHYPIRSREQYRRKIKIGFEALLERNEHKGIGTHWRRWYGFIQSGTFDAEFDKLIYNIKMF